MNKVKIAFFDAKPYDKKSFEEVNKKFDFEIKYFKPHLSEDTIALVNGFDVVCIFVNDFVTPEVGDELIKRGVKLIALRCAGYNNIDLKTVYGRIHVVRVPAYSPYAVAEHSVALMMALNRKTHRAYYRTRDGNFNINGLSGFDMKGKTAGIIGTGQIGRILIKILNGFEMNVIAYDPFPNKEHSEALGFDYVPLEELYKRSDIISLHCPLTKETRHLINKKSINLMKKKVMIINTGRGQLINTKDLIDGLKEGKIDAAGLDVYEEETDWFFEDFSGTIIDDDVLARLLTFPNVLITSHQAFFTNEALYNIASTTLSNIKDYNNGDFLKNEICYQCGTPNCNKKKGKNCF